MTAPFSRRYFQLFPRAAGTGERKLLSPLVLFGLIELFVDTPPTCPALFIVPRAKALWRSM